MRVAAILALGVTACASLDQFDLPVSADGVIPGTLSNIPGAGFPGGLPGGGELSQRIENQGADPEDVTSVRLTSGKVSLVSPANEHLAYIEKIEFFVEADGLERKRIAFKDTGFDTRPTSVDLTLEDVDLAPYVTAPSMQLVPSIALKQRPARDLSIKVDLVMHVDLSVIE